MRTKRERKMERYNLTKAETEELIKANRIWLFQNYKVEWERDLFVALGNTVLEIVNQYNFTNHKAFRKRVKEIFIEFNEATKRNEEELEKFLKQKRNKKNDKLSS